MCGPAWGTAVTAQLVFCGSCFSRHRAWVSLVAWSGLHSNSACGRPHGTVHSVEPPGHMPASNSLLTDTDTH